MARVWQPLSYHGLAQKGLRGDEDPIRGVVESTAGLYGDLQGIAGRSLVEIDGLELPLLGGLAADAAE